MLEWFFRFRFLQKDRVKVCCNGLLEVRFVRV